MKYLLAIDHGYGEVSIELYDKITIELLELLTDVRDRIWYFVSVKEEIDVGSFLEQHYCKNERLRSQALAKLTSEEREALGLKL